MVPDGWAETALEQVAEVAIGKTPARKETSFWDPAKTTQNRWATIADIQSRYISETSEHISDLGVQHSNARLVPAGTLLMSFKLTLGRAAITSKPMYTNEAIAAFYPNGRATTEYLYYLLPTLALEESSDRAVKGRTLNKAKLRGLRLALPPLPEQRKIAAILSSVDDAIEKTQAVINQVQVVKRGLMQELLTRGLPGRHTRFKQTEIGNIPKEWEVVRLGDIAAVKGGKRMPKGRPFADSVTPYPYIRVCDFKNGSIDTSQIEYVPPEDREKIRRYTISQDDLYISIAGTLGIVGTVPPSLDGAQLTENAAKIVIEDKGQANRDFLKIAMNAEESQAQLERLRGVGGGVPKLALFRIEEVLLPLPCIQEQRDIVGAVHRIDDYHLTLEAELDEVKKVKAGIMSVLLTGELRVTPDTEVA